MNIVVFMTYRNSLSTWRDAGILDRELAIYRKFCEKGHSVTLITYGGSDEISLAALVDDRLKILRNRWRLPNAIYGLFIPLLFWSTLRSADVLKTNQLFGAHIAQRANKIFKKFLVVRMGYDYLSHQLQKSSVNLFSRWYAKIYEARNLRSADLILVSTKEISLSIKQRTPSLPRVVVVPNYIDAEVWSPPHKSLHSPKKTRRCLRMCFFGRLVEQKNFLEFIRACEGHPVELTLIGDGPLKEQLLDCGLQHGLKLYAFARRPQYELIETLREHDLFVLPSKYEGHPKALIEAMAFGMPVLGANSPGIRELIRDGQTGILVDPSRLGFEEGIRRVLKMSKDEKSVMGRKAREWAMANFSLDHIVEIELAAIRRGVSS